jgi:hypothetical protein
VVVPRILVLTCRTELVYPHECRGYEMIDVDPNWKEQESCYVVARLGTISDATLRPFMFS